MNANRIHIAALALIAFGTSLTCAAAPAAQAPEGAVQRIVVVAKRIPVLQGEVPRIVITAKRLAPVDTLANAQAAKPGRTS